MSSEAGPAKPKLIAEMAPSLKARIAGVVYLLIFISAPSGASSATPLMMIINLACDTGVALIFNFLLRPVSRKLSFAAAFLRLVFVVAMSVNCFLYFGAATLFQGSHSAPSFDKGYGLTLIPFGLHCLLTGYLIFKSTFLPRTLGVLMMVAGAAYSIFLWPSLGDRLFFPYIVVPAVVGEGALTLWLLVRGVNNQRWEAQNARSLSGRMQQLEQLTD